MSFAREQGRRCSCRYVSVVWFNSMEVNAFARYPY
jgi:hypothetical protein